MGGFSGACLLGRAVPPWLWGPQGAVVAPAWSQGWSFPTIPTIPVGLSQGCPLLQEPAQGLVPNSSSLPALYLFPKCPPFPWEKEIFSLSPDFNPSRPGAT